MTCVENTLEEACGPASIVPLTTLPDEAERPQEEQKKGIIATGNEIEHAKGKSIVSPPSPIVEEQISASEIFPTAWSSLVGLEIS